MNICFFSVQTLYIWLLITFKIAFLRLLMASEFIVFSSSSFNWFHSFVVLVWAKVI